MVGSRSVVVRSLLATATAAALLFGASLAQARTIRHLPKHKRTATTATNWSGYAIDGSSATQVIGTWIADKAACAPGETSWSSPWVGIDGDNSNTVEQTGTDSDCNRGVASYYAWYEMYPKNAVVLSMKVNPGDTFTGSVTYSGTTFTLSLTDDTTHVTRTENLSSRKARRSSVEWIVEGPSTGLLTNFGTDPFSAASAAINGAASAGLSTFSNPEQITMVSSAGTVRARPSTVSSNGFTDTWVHG
jgi:Peptidase A4 family